MPQAKKIQSVPLLEKHSKWSLHYWTGHNLEWYFRIILRPVIYLTIVNIIVAALGSHVSTALLVNTAFLPLVFLAELIVYGWLGARIVAVTSIKTLPPAMRWATATISGALTGLSIGIIMSFFKVFWFRQPWAFFNIVTEPGLRFFEGLVIAGVVAIITMLILKAKK